MTIHYVANIRIPTEKAHGAQIMKTCGALVRSGAKVELIVPTRHNPIQEDVFSYYGMTPSFPITRLPVVDTVGFGRIGFLLQTYFFAYRVERYCTQKRADVIYGRDERVLFYLSKKGLPVVWESHTGAWSQPARQLAKSAKKIIVISNGLLSFYLERGIPKQLLSVAPDAIDSPSVTHVEKKNEARARLCIPLDVPVVAYIGRIEEGKGAFTFLNASRILPEQIVPVVIGGERADIEKLKPQYPKVLFLGSRPYRELMANQVAADVLVIPNSAQSHVSAIFTSPLKLFSAIASNVPIVASDVPSIREILDDTTAYLCTPDNPMALAEHITRAIEHKEESQKKAAAALVIARSHTWDARAQRILKVLATI